MTGEQKGRVGESAGGCFSADATVTENPSQNVGSHAETRTYGVQHVDRHESVGSRTILRSPDTGHGHEHHQHRDAHAETNSKFEEDFAKYPHAFLIDEEGHYAQNEQ